MSEPAYVSIAGEYARKIRRGEYSPGTQLPSYAEIAKRHSVSDIVVRKAIELLQSQGLIGRRERRRGIFVTERPNLVRVSPERQLQGAEETFRNESNLDVRVERESEQVRVADDLAQQFKLAVGDSVVHTITRAAEDGRPISISDTYQPLDVADISDAAFLDETVADRLPPSTHAEWLGTRPGDIVKTVHQRYVTNTGRLIMVSDISYPRDRYDSFVFRMCLTSDSPSRANI